ncbi:uncharacterized protein LOC115927174 [Strongylocentrotus purpuratus]|uniref:B box-type domain-containing protein n=1 Tax=Strongylocentrotus purpuratus TaxID=7668 RepID=A0A7M7T295_STRPU|nr:uncharacterized protein LOC115927174 [Strongylocentrotus purpuratus]
MASKFPTDSGVQLKSRKGHDVTWSCDKHGEPIKFFCAEHGIPICHPCAMKDHQKPCKLDDIEDVILEIGEKLDDKLLKIETAKPHLTKLGSKIKSCLDCLHDHFQLISEKAQNECDIQMKNVEQIIEQEEIRALNDEADEEIRLIKERRDRRIKACLEKAEQKQEAIRGMHAKLSLECKEMQDTIGTKILDLQRKNQHQIDTVTNISQKMKRIKLDDKALVCEASLVIAALGDTLTPHVDDEVDMVEYLDKIEQEVQGLKFIGGRVGGEYIAQIEGQAQRWELVSSIIIPLTVNGPLLRGFVSDDEMCVLDSKTNDLYVTNLKKQHTQKVIEGSADTHITSCAPINSDLIVCGKRRFDCPGNAVEGCITLFDREWQRVRDIVIPEENAFHNELWVDVDKDGMILAAQEYHHEVYVINPADGKLVDTIELPDLNVHDGIHALSSGCFGTCIGYREFWVFDRSANKVTGAHDRAYGESWFAVDKLTDAIYVTYKSPRETSAIDQGSRDMFVVDHVSGDGTSKRVVEYGHPYRSFQVGPSFVSPSGKLINCDGNRLLVYKKCLRV